MDGESTNGASHGDMDTPEEPRRPDAGLDRSDDAGSSADVEFLHDEKPVEGSPIDTGGDIGDGAD